MRVRPADADDLAWIRDLLVREWSGSRIIAGGGRLIDAATLPALIAGERQGLATYEIAANRAGADLVTLNALAPRRGIGTALVEALTARLRADGIRELRVSLTNDNLDALRFYQRRGFRLAAVHPGAIDEARRLKPVIPVVGHYGIPIRDRLDLVRMSEPI